MFLLLNSQVTFYASYLGFNYVNTIGFLLMCLYMIQLLSGLQLSLYYNYSLSYYAFDSIQFIMKDVNIGYIIRIFHIIGSSFYMLFLWLHLLRGLFIKLFFYSFAYNLPYNYSFIGFTPLELATIRYIPKRLPIDYYNRFTSNRQWSSPDKLPQSPVNNPSWLEAIISSSFSLIPFSLISFSGSLCSFNPSTLLSKTVEQGRVVEVSFVNSFYFTFYYVYFIGIIIFILSIAVSFIGYTLVFGNLSYYGVIVVLGILSSVPSLLWYFVEFFFLFISFLLILFIIVFLFILP